jgi:hypothetical protein
MNPIWTMLIYIFILFIISEIALRFFGVPQPQIIPEPNGMLREEE